MSGGVIPFVRKGKGSDLAEKEKIGSLVYEVYKRGVVHISNPKGLKFKKNCDSFEDAMDNLNLESLTEGQEVLMRGSGDNDHLVFARKNGDIDITLRKREFGTIEKVRGLLRKVVGPRKKAV